MIAKKQAQLQFKAFELVDALFCEVNPIPVKHALKSSWAGIWDHCRMSTYARWKMLTLRRLKKCNDSATEYFREIRRNRT